MTVAKINLALIFVSLAVLGACGSPGEPLPPSLELARPVSDLRALRKGNTVILTWTAPTSTTDRHNIRHPGPTEICRASGRLQQCGEPIAMLPPTNNHDQDVSRTYTDTLRSFSLDPDAKWDAANKRVIDSCVGPPYTCSKPGYSASPRIVAVPVINTQDAWDAVHSDSGGSQGAGNMTVKIVALLGFFVEGMGGTGGKDVVGCLATKPDLLVSNGGSVSPSAAFIKAVTLVR